MRIGFLNLLYSKPSERAGVGAHIVTLARELARQGHDVTAVTSGTGLPWIEDGVHVVPLGPVDRYVTVDQVASPAFVWRRLAYMHRAAEYIRTAGFDVVEAADGGLEPLLLLRQRPCPVVMKLHGSFELIHGRSRGLVSVMRGLERHVLQRADALYASSTRYARMVARDYRVPRDRIRIIPCGIDLREIDAPSIPGPSAREAALSGEHTVLLSVGNAAPRKGAPLFAEVARQWRDPGVRFVLVCSDAAWLERTSLPANLHVVGLLSKAEFFGLMASADVVVFPSKFESFSIATHEAMLLGRSVVVSQQIPLEGPARAYPRLVTLDRLDAASLGHAIRQALDGEGGGGAALSPEQLAPLRRAYGIDAVAERTLAFYQEAIDGYRRSTAAARVRGGLGADPGAELESRAQRL